MKPTTCLHYGDLVSHADKSRDFPVISALFKLTSPLNQGGEP